MMDPAKIKYVDMDSKTQPDKRIIKCVKMLSERLPLSVCYELQDMFRRYGMCKTYLYQQFGGISHMTDIDSWQKLRQKVRAWLAELKEENKPGYEQMFGIMNRHWVMALSEVVANLKTSWSKLSRKIKERIRDNDNLVDSEKSYCYYVVSARSVWQAILLRKDFKASKNLKEIMKEVSADRIKSLNNLIRRLTRKNKPKLSACKNNTCILLDQEMYSITDQDGTSVISFVSLKKYKRFTAVLRGAFKYNKKGNIQLILKDHGRRIEIHKSILSRTKDLHHAGEAGADKGYATLLSYSNDKEYGKNFGKILSKESKRINDRNTNRNHLIQKHKDLRNEITILEGKSNTEKLNETEKENLRLLKSKASRIKINNLGNTKYNREHNRAKEHMKQVMNSSIRKSYAKYKAGLIAKEDLTFVSESNKNKGANFNRNMSSWVKGELDARMEYIAKYMRMDTVDVNPAYTSKFCNCCGAPIKERIGEHKEIAVCPNCGEINANTNAAKNIRDRIHDSEITIYTPYKEVKEILLKRYQNKKKTS